MQRSLKKHNCPLPKQCKKTQMCQQQHINKFKLPDSIHTKLSDVKEMSITKSKSLPRQLSYKSNLSLSSDELSSFYIFWDESEIDEVKMLRITTTNVGRKNVSEIHIAIDQQVANGSDKLDLYNFLF
ncbi:Hypothetical_protein [Hexamita inflata]|uniref:Hypothetical_protein n=1 Tax=Hexamita inflata TaxID=28002 RepID=A0AA86NPJ5_9EUKA|nr:Hypothetical protein HINF_LOCUS10448 [Hexamita inflata]